MTGHPESSYSARASLRNKRGISSFTHNSGQWTFKPTQTHKIKQETSQIYCHCFLRFYSKTCDRMFTTCRYFSKTQIMNIRFNEMKCLSNVMNSDWSHALKESVYVPWNCTSVKGSIYVVLCILKGFCTVPFIRRKRGSVQKQALCVDKRHTLLTVPLKSRMDGERDFLCFIRYSPPKREMERKSETDYSPQIIKGLKSAEL